MIYIHLREEGSELIYYMDRLTTSKGCLPPSFSPSLSFSLPSLPSFLPSLPLFLPFPSFPFLPLQKLYLLIVKNNAEKYLKRIYATHQFSSYLSHFRFHSLEATTDNYSPVSFQIFYKYIFFQIFININVIINTQLYCFTTGFLT